MTLPETASRISIATSAIPRVLSIAGSDSSGGAGIQADIKTITMLGAYAATAITAVTAQNTCIVSAVEYLSPKLVVQQIDAVMDDIGCDGVKVGMLATVENVDAVCDRLQQFDHSIPIVVDPVFVSTSGVALLARVAIQQVVDRLLPLATVLTPNIPEAVRLTGMDIKDSADMRAAALHLLQLGPRAVLLKGGHLDDDTVVDVLACRADNVETFARQRINTLHTHGTGCTLSAALAVGLARKLDLRTATVQALDFVQAAIRGAPGFGRGHGPLNHMVNMA